MARLAGNVQGVVVQMAIAAFASAFGLPAEALAKAGDVKMDEVSRKATAKALEWLAAQPGLDLPREAFARAREILNV